MTQGLTFYHTPYTFYLFFGVGAAVYPRPQGLESSKADPPPGDRLNRSIQVRKSFDSSAVFLNLKSAIESIQNPLKLANVLRP
jgi:hypothetical protein